MRIRGRVKSFASDARKRTGASPDLMQQRTRLEDLVRVHDAPLSPAARPMCLFLRRCTTRPRAARGTRSGPQRCVIFSSCTLWLALVVVSGGRKGWANAALARRAARGRRETSRGRARRGAQCRRTLAARTTEASTVNFCSGAEGWSEFALVRLLTSP